MGLQSAFVFAKPHANRFFVIEEIKKKFAAMEIGILKEGEMTGEAIDENQYIDQHYYAIASKVRALPTYPHMPLHLPPPLHTSLHMSFYLAPPPSLHLPRSPSISLPCARAQATILKPAQLNIPTDKFKAHFGEEWSEVLAKGRALNAIDAKAKLGLDADTLDAKWGAAKKAGKLIKFGGGFYCGYLAEYDLYTFNAFFMTMRGSFTAPGTSIHYFVVCFDSDKLSWADFRGKARDLSQDLPRSP